jgi:uncharacterized Zn-finger protein
MTDAGHISTSSTGEEPPINTCQNIQKNQMIQSWRNITSKRFKNLVECYPCTVEDCQILFESKDELDKHHETHSKLFKCEFPGCEKSFMKLTNLRKHNKSHSKNKKIYFCPFEGCNKSFTASYSVTLHYRIHTGNKPFQCDICGKKFFDKANWQYHVNNMHKKIISKNLICQHKNCEHKSKSIKQLLMHHDKLEEQCVKEKNILLKLIMSYQSAILSILDSKENNITNNIIFEDNVGIDDEKRNIWSNYINKYNLDEELKEYAKLILIQSKNVINSSTDKNKYKGILGNY